MGRWGGAYTWRAGGWVTEELAQEAPVGSGSPRYPRACPGCRSVPPCGGVLSSPLPRPPAPGLSSWQHSGAGKDRPVSLSWAELRVLLPARWWHLGARAPGPATLPISRACPTNPCPECSLLPRTVSRDLPWLPVAGTWPVSQKSRGAIHLAEAGHLGLLGTPPSPRKEGKLYGWIMCLFLQQGLIWSPDWPGTPEPVSASTCWHYRHGPTLA